MDERDDMEDTRMVGRRRIVRAALIAGALGSAAGCASADSTQRLERVRAENVLASPSVAVARARAVPVKPGQVEYLELLASDGVVKVDEQRSFFKVVSLPLAARPEAQVEIAARCDCVGFRKFIFVPRVFVFDGDGQPVPLSAPEYEARQADLSNPLRVVASWRFPVRATGIYRFLVAADNAYAGQTVATAQGGPFNGGLAAALVGIHVSAVAVGEFTFLAP